MNLQGMDAAFNLLDFLHYSRKINTCVCVKGKSKQAIT